MSTHTFLATTLAGVFSTALSLTLATAQEPHPFTGTGYPPGSLPLNGSSPLPSNPTLPRLGGSGTAGVNQEMLVSGEPVGLDPRFPTPAGNVPTNERTEVNEPYQEPGDMSHGIGGMSHGVGGMSHLGVGSPVGRGSLETATHSPLIPFGGNGYAGGMSGPGPVWVIPRASSTVPSPASSGGTAGARLRAERGPHHNRDG